MPWGHNLVLLTKLKDREKRLASFSPVPDEVWNFRVGGYQVCEKWLKDRRERQLELEDIRVYCRVVSALGLTIQIQKEIDHLFGQVDAKLLTGIPQPHK